MSLTIENTCACVEILENSISEKISFTAYDITMDLRRDGYWVEHCDVKKFVHNYMMDLISSGSSYLKELVQITDSAKAYVYRTDEDDEDQEKEDGIYTIDKRGRLCIPAKITRSCGFSIGNNAFCYDGCNSLIIKNSNNMGVSIAFYKVDKYGNIRISKSNLKYVFNNADKYEIYGDGNQIRVKKWAYAFGLGGSNPPTATNLN